EELLGALHLAAEAGDLGPDQRGAIAEARRAARGPSLEHLEVREEGAHPRGPLRRRGRVMARGQRERAIEVELGGLEERRRRPEERRGLRRGLERRGVLAREGARLQRADVVPARRD